MDLLLQLYEINIYKLISLSFYFVFIFLKENRYSKFPTIYIYNTL